MFCIEQLNLQNSNVYELHLLFTLTSSQRYSPELVIVMSTIANTREY